MIKIKSIYNKLEINILNGAMLEAFILKFGAQEGRPRPRLVHTELGLQDTREQERDFKGIRIQREDIKLS